MLALARLGESPRFNRVPRIRPERGQEGLCGLRPTGHWGYPFASPYAVDGYGLCQGTTHALKLGSARQEDETGPHQVARTQRDGTTRV